MISYSKSTYLYSEKVPTDVQIQSLPREEKWNCNLVCQKSHHFQELSVLPTVNIKLLFLRAQKALFNTLKYHAFLRGVGVLFVCLRVLVALVVKQSFAWDLLFPSSLPLAWVPRIPGAFQVRWRGLSPPLVCSALTVQYCTVHTVLCVYGMYRSSESDPPSKIPPPSLLPPFTGIRSKPFPSSN